MKRTRSLFVLTGNRQDVLKVLNNLEFKGLSVLQAKNVTEQNISDVFKNNKSVVCFGQIPKSFETTAIYISVIRNRAVSCKHKYYILMECGNFSAQFRHIANSCNCDIGDHKSNSSGLHGVPKIADCVYCKYINYESAPRTVYSSPNFFVIPTVGEFITGYLLIIPYQHVMSLAEVDVALYNEFFSVLEDISFILKLTYRTSNILVWENGTGNGGLGKAKDSIVHAHVHIAPSSLNADIIQSVSGFDFSDILNSDIPKYGNHSYLLIKGKGRNWKINDDANLYIPRQYVRQLLADEYGLSGDLWNWRKYPFYEKIQQTRVDISRCLSQNWDDLPERIKKRTENYLLNFN